MTEKEALLIKLIEHYEMYDYPLTQEAIYALIYFIEETYKEHAK